MNKHFSSGVVVYTKKDETVVYLLLHNVKGHWDFPKGTIEAGENQKTAAVRELKEEAGITATLHDGFDHSIFYDFINYAGNPSHKEVHFFVGRANSADVQLSHEHDDFTWLPFEQALERATYQEGKELLKKADQFIKTLS